ncbi:MAG: HNH endonuclease [Dehalococcoidia bacterium]
MSRTYLPRAVRERIWAAAKGRCGYCLSREIVSGLPLQIEHIVPLGRGGTTVEDNLWLACGSCNAHKGTRIFGVDPLTGAGVRLFDPRRQIWVEHFAWTAGGTVIEGISPTGRATTVTLHLNRELLVDARRVWAAAGWHPPRD